MSGPHCKSVLSYCMWYPGKIKVLNWIELNSLFNVHYSLYEACIYPVRCIGPGHVIPMSQSAPGVYLPKVIIASLLESLLGSDMITYHDLDYISVWIRYLLWSLHQCLEQILYTVIPASLFGPDTYFDPYITVRLRYLLWSLHHCLGQAYTHTLLCWWSGANQTLILKTRPNHLFDTFSIFLHFLWQKEYLNCIVSQYITYYCKCNSNV